MGKAVHLFQPLYDAAFMINGQQRLADSVLKQANQTGQFLGLTALSIPAWKG